MRNAILTIMAAAGMACTGAGCASTDTYLPPLAHGHQALLFDALPGYPTATHIARANRWPATHRQFQDTEVLYYRESYHDVQGYWPSRSDRTYRRFEVLREGTVVR